MANDPNEERDPVEVLAAEFLEKQRGGENPKIADFAAQYPHLAFEIRELFPAILAMEQLKSHCETPSGSRASLGATKLERLGEFRLLNEIGRGGMGVVYEAHHESLGRHVAVKVLPKQSARQCRAFQREARTAARLHHTNIVPLFGVGEQDGYHYIVMQLIRGVDLEAVLEALRDLRSSGKSTVGEATTSTPRRLRYVEEAAQFARRLMATGGFSTSEPISVFGGSTSSGECERSLASGSSEPSDPPLSDIAQGEPEGVESSAQSMTLGPLYWRRIALIGRQTAEALHYAHRHQTQHRDIKPANLLLDAQGVVWVTDFGLAKAVDDSQGSHQGNLAGTLRYMAPEQFSGQSDHRSDIYSLGLTLYELITLEPAFADSSRSNLIRKITQERPVPLSHRCPGIPRDLEAIVMQAIERDPSRRYATAGDLARDLQRFMDGRSVSARHTPLFEQVWRWSHRNQAIAVLSAAASLLLLTTAALAAAEYLNRTRAWERESQLRAQAELERMRAEANLQIAAEAFEDVFDRVTGVPLSASLEAAMEEFPAHAQTRPVVGENEAGILKGLLAFYEQFAKQNEGDLRWQRETARAFFRSGEIQFRLGDTLEAETTFRRALGIYQKLAAGEPANSDYIAWIAATRNQLANVAAETGRMDIAFEESRRSWQGLLEHPADRISSAACQIELAQAFNRYAIATPRFGFGRSSSRTKSQPDDSKRYLSRSIDIVQKLLTADPQNLEYSLTMAESYRYLWSIESMSKKFSEAQQARQQSISMLEALADAFPTEPECRVKLVEVFLLPYRFGEDDLANPELRGQADRAVEIASDLVRQFPQIPKYKVVLAQSYWAASRSHFYAGDADKAQAALDQALELQRSLVEQFPTRSRNRLDLVRSLDERTRQIRRAGRSDALAGALHDLITAMEEVPDSHRHFSTSSRSRSKVYAEYAEALHELGHVEEARTAQLKAEELTKESTRRSPRSSARTSTVESSR